MYCKIRHVVIVDMQCIQDCHIDNYNNKMTAAADKVQLVLQSTLQQCLPLLKKGLFTGEQLRDMMVVRKTQEHAMRRPNYQLSDYLTAIEYEYSLERERLRRMEEGFACKKQSKGDFALIKRILRLWTRATAKYKYRAQLWKQFMQFCITIGSRKHFYKALTGALRFMPFELDFWRIGAAYEVELAHNWWRARKVFLKGLKIMPKGDKKIQLALHMLHFEAEFLCNIVQRENQFQEQATIKFIGGQLEQQSQEQQEQIAVGDTKNYHNVMYLIYRDATQNIQSCTVINTFLKKISELIQKNTNKTVLYNLKQLKERIRKELLFVKEQIKNEQIVIETQVIENKQYHIFQRSKKALQQQTQGIIKMTNDNKCSVDWKQAQKSINNFCLKPQLLTKLLFHLLEADGKGLIAFLSKNQNVPLPPDFIRQLIVLKMKVGFIQTTDEFERYLHKKIARLTPQNYRQNMPLLKIVFLWNKTERRAKQNNRILQSISIHYRHQPQFIERCGMILNEI